MKYVGVLGFVGSLVVCLNALKGHGDHPCQVFVLLIFERPPHISGCVECLVPGACFRA